MPSSTAATATASMRVMVRPAAIIDCRSIVRKAMSCASRSPSICVFTRSAIRSLCFTRSFSLIPSLIVSCNPLA